MSKGLIAAAISTVAMAVTTIAVVIALATGVLKMNPYVDTYDVYVSARSSRSAQGDVFVLSTSNRKTLTVQLSQCVNMENVGVGDHITVVMVNDKDNVLQCVVKVDGE